MKITIDTDDLAKLKASTEFIKLETEAEVTLSRILEIESQIAEIKELAKAKLLEEGRKLNPDFKSWEADSIRISMRTYGAKYYVSNSDFNLAPKELFKTEATVVAPNEDYDTITKALKGAGFEVVVTKGKDGDKLKIARTVDTKAVEKWEKTHRGLPAGINQVKDRPVSLNFSLKNKEEADNE